MKHCTRIRYLRMTWVLLGFTESTNILDDRLSWNILFDDMIYYNDNILLSLDTLKLRLGPPTYIMFSYSSIPVVGDAEQGQQWLARYLHLIENDLCGVPVRRSPSAVSCSIQAWPNNDSLRRLATDIRNSFGRPPRICNYSRMLVICFIIFAVWSVDRK